MTKQEFVTGIQNRVYQKQLDEIISHIDEDEDVYSESVGINKLLSNEK